MIGELILGAVLIVVSVLNFFGNRALIDERRRFLAAVMSKDPGEYVAVERATAPWPTRNRPKRVPEDQPANPIGF